MLLESHVGQYPSNNCLFTHKNVIEFHYHLTAGQSVCTNFLFIIVVIGQYSVHGKILLSNKYN